MIINYHPSVKKNNEISSEVDVIGWNSLKKKTIKFVLIFYFYGIWIITYIPIYNDTTWKLGRFVVRLIW